MFSYSSRTKMSMERHINPKRSVTFNAATCSVLTKDDLSKMNFLWLEIEKRKSSTVDATENGRKKSIDQSTKPAHGIMRWAPAPLTPAAQETVNMLLIRWFCTSPIPFNAVEKRFAAELFNLLRPGYSRVKRQQLSNKYLGVLYCPCKAIGTHSPRNDDNNCSRRMVGCEKSIDLWWCPCYVSPKWRGVSVFY